MVEIKSYQWDQTVKICPNCDREIQTVGFDSHFESCSRLPTADEICQMLDDDPLLTVNSLARQFHVGNRTIYNRLEKTRWNHRRLTLRGHNVRTHGIKNGRRIQTNRKQKIVDRGGVFCLFCRICNDAPICEFCAVKLEQFADDESIPETWGSLVLDLWQSGDLPRKWKTKFKWLKNDRVLV